MGCTWISNEEILDEEVDLPSNEIGQYIETVNELYEELRAPAEDQKDRSS